MGNFLLQETRIMGFYCSALEKEEAIKLGQSFWDNFLDPKRTVNRR
jgi:hypothetical protein